MNKKILILGAGNAQIDLIKYCKSMGLETYGCSYTNTDKGIPLLDHFEQINIVDDNEIKKYFLDNQIDYIYSVGSDIAMPTICKVAEETGKYSFISYKTVNLCCNKHLMREAMGTSRYNIPYVVASSYEDVVNFDSFPAVIKPVDSQGQRGVYFLYGKEDMKTYFDKSIAYSRAGKVIVEKFIPGDEVSVNGYVKNGKVIFAITSDRESFDQYPGGIIKAHHLPSRYENTETVSHINELVRETVEKLEISNGPVYFQIRVHNGKPYLIEVAPRLDGCHMWRLIEKYTGVNLLELTMKHFLQGEVEIENYYPASTPMHLDFFSEPTDTIFCEEKHIDSFSDYRCMYYKNGDKVRKLNGYIEKCGYRIYKSPAKIGVIGGSGFVGQSLINQYKNKFEFIDISRKNGSVSDYSAEEIAKALKGCDSAVILASKKVNPNEEQTRETYTENLKIAENSLIACEKLGIKNIVFASSRCVYSNKQPSPVDENGKIDPINFYGISKLEAEKICSHFNDKYNMNIKILRIAQIIGKSKDKNAVSVFMNNAVSGKPLTIYGNAEGKRDYIYIKDVCKAIILSLLNFDKKGIYNIGSGKGTSSRELAQAVIQGFNSKSEIVMLPEKPEDTTVTYLDVSKANADLGFSCDFTLEKSFEDLIRL